MLLLHSVKSFILLNHHEVNNMCWFMVTCITVKWLKCVENVSEANGMYVLYVTENVRDMYVLCY